MVYSLKMHIRENGCTFKVLSLVRSVPVFLATDSARIQQQKNKTLYKLHYKPNWCSYVGTSVICNQLAVLGKSQLFSRSHCKGSKSFLFLSCRLKQPTDLSRLFLGLSLTHVSVWVCAIPKDFFERPLVLLIHQLSRALKSIFLCLDLKLAVGKATAVIYTLESSLRVSVLQKAKYRKTHYQRIQEDMGNAV